MKRQNLKEYEDLLAESKTFMKLQRERRLKERKAYKGKRLRGKQ